MTRWLPCSALLLTVASWSQAATGPAVPEMAAFDRTMTDLMHRWEIPGGSLAVARNGQLVLKRGYALADVEEQQPVEPDSLFRIASVSKPVTAATVLVLVEQGRLDLDAKVVELLGSIEPLPGRSIEPQFREITVRHLLHHTGGFDRRKSFDPMFRHAQIARALGLSPPVDSRSIVRFMWGRPLDFKPGTQHAYSNFGYCLLGRVIAEITGTPYEEAVKALVLEPAGIGDMRLARTPLAGRAPGEVRYYPYSNGKDLGPSPYEHFYLEAMDAHGGWMASAVDLIRFATALDGSRKPPLLKPATAALIESRPAVSADKPAYYALGWMVRPVGERANWWHAGSLPGTTCLLVRTHHGLVWAVVFNARPKDSGKFLAELDRAMWQAARAVETWPEHDFLQQRR